MLPRYREVADRALMHEAQAEVFVASVRAAATGSARKVPPGGDHVQLRGIPVIGHGVGGASPGSRPDVDGVRHADRAAALIAFA